MRALVTCLVLIAGLGVVRVGARGDSNTSFEQQEKLRLEAHFDSVIGELRSARVDHLSVPQLQARTRSSPRFASIVTSGASRGTTASRSLRRTSAMRAGRCVRWPGSWRNRDASTWSIASRARRTTPMSTTCVPTTTSRVGPTARESRSTKRRGCSRPTQTRIASASCTARRAWRWALGRSPARRSTRSSPLATGWWGALTGVAVLSLGLPMLAEPGANGTMAKTNVVIGVGSVLLSVRGFRHKEAGPSTSATQESRPLRQRQVAITPIVFPSGKRASLGIGVGATF